MTPGILAHANARTASLPSSLPVSVHAGRKPGHLARGQEALLRSLYGGLVSNGTDGDTLGRLGDRYPCQTVPTVLVAGLVGHGQLCPRIWLHQAGRVAGAGMWPRWSKKSSACGDLTPAGTRRKKRGFLWVQARVQVWMGAYQCHTALAPPDWLSSSRLVSSRRHRALPTFPSPSPVEFSLPTDPGPQKSQGFSQLGARWRSARPSSSVSSGCW